jgi:hypothetical protein
MSALALGHPLSTLRDGAVGFVEGERRPLPLSAIRIAIEITRGLAIVTTMRSFRNDEGVPIEAVLTFPVPFDAVMTRLCAVIDGRTLNAKAQPRAQARRSYEDALDRCKTAVLHEEALRGVHVLSVGQLAPGKSVDVIAETVMPLSMLDGVPVLRIPTTVGQVDGASPLLPADDLTTGDNALQSAELKIRVDSGSPSLHGTPLTGELATTVSLDQAIEISVPGARLVAIDGHDSKGRRVRLSLSPVPRGQGRFDASILFDRSGSTGHSASRHGARRAEWTTIWDAMKSGLAEELRNLLPSDRVSLWQFDNTCQLLGSAQGVDATRLLPKLGPPSGGTRLGAAIEAVAAAGSRDILVLTDGQTWASEVHSAASRGCRISAILIGPGSLDAMIGHLASITGGEIFYALDSDVGPAMRSAIASMRSPAAPLAGSASQGAPTAVSVVRGGVRIEATWETTPTGHPVDAIGRYSASLALPLLDEEQATNLAAEHGLCSHLTSLLLVDEDGDAIDGVPEMRKIPLALPAGQRLAYSMDSLRCLRDLSASKMVGYDRDEFAIELHERDSKPVWRHALQASTKLDLPELSESNVASKIEWDRLANDLLAEDLSGLTDLQRRTVQWLAQSKEVVDLSTAMGVDPVQIATALLAETVQSRTPQRLARRVLRNAPASLLALAKTLTRKVLKDMG